MRKRGRTDANQTQVVEALRSKPGISVYVTSSLGEGFPDIVVGNSGKNYLFEIKDPNKPPSGRKLTEDEIEFRKRWRGQIHTIHTWQEAFSIMQICSHE